YSWKNAALVEVGTTATVSNLPAGTYSVTVSDNCFTKSNSVTIGEPAIISVSNVAQSTIACKGENATVTITAAGGTGSLSYTFDGVTNSTGIFTHAAGNNLLYSVTDANSCKAATGSFSIVEPSLISASGTTLAATCIGSNTGAIDLSVTGGTGEYTYLWSNGATTQDLSGLADGIYTVVVSDSNGCIADGTLSFTIESFDNVPIAVDDNLTTIEDQILNENVSTNDDPSCDGGNIWSLISGTGHGNIILNTDGTFTYTPDTNYAGTDSFTYKITDINGDESTAKVTITIIPVNDAPIAKDDINSTLKDIPASGNVLTNDIDPEGDLLTIKTQPVTPPANGTVVINADGTYTYSPNIGFVGTDSFVYEVCDNGTPSLCDQARVTINVLDFPNLNNPPVANNDNYQGSVNHPVKGNVISNDFDAEGNLNPNSVTLVGPAPASGTLTLNPNGTFTYTPVSGFIGQVSFDYQVCDLGTPPLCDLATVTIDILANPLGNSTFATDDSFIGKEDFPLTGNVLTNDNDPEGDLQTVNTTPVKLPSHGSVIINANGTFTYTPEANYFGGDQFVYQVCDNGTPVACDQATVYLLIMPVNDDPVAFDDFNTTNEDTPVSGNVSLNDIPSVNGGNVWTIVTAPSNGSVVLNTNGSYTYTPDDDFNGTDTFVYKVCDIDGDCDQAIVTITVISVNDVPVANDDLANVNVDGSLSDFVDENDIWSGDGGNEYTLVTPPSNGSVFLNPDGSYTYTPNINFVGTDSFTYKLCDADGDCDDAKVTIEVEDILLPNQILTPNGDGINDTFIIEGINLYPNNKLTLFNRWGNVVYEKSGYLNEWDGNANVTKIGTKSLPAGTYYFIIDYGSSRHKTGFVYLDK
ncbi:MAG: Ig-like domain-containing protein, partial [Bacteroidota bacterium]|nr:Ig-like domain-containing protein [Bacteroidota bacterium]